MNNTYCVILRCLCCLSLFYADARAFSDEANSAPAKTTILETRPFAAGVWSPPVIEVAIDDARHLFMVDTGASATVFDSLLRDKLGRLVETRTSHLPCSDNARVEFFEQSSEHLPQIGSLVLKTNSPVACAELAGASRIVGREIHGIIGVDFLSQFVVTFDFDRCQLVFQSELERKPGRSATMLLHPNFPSPFIFGRCEGATPIGLMVDTGATNSGFANETWKESLGSGTLSLRGASTTLDVSGQTCPSRWGIVDQLHIGGNTLTEVAVTESAIAYVGIDVLSRFVMTIDFPREKLYIKQGNRFFATPRWMTAGIDFRLTDDLRRMRVIRIDDDSAAANSGLREGDELISIGGRPAPEMMSQLLRLMFESRGKSVALRVVRDGNESDIALPIIDDDLNRGIRIEPRKSGSRGR